MKKLLILLCALCLMLGLGACSKAGNNTYSKEYVDEFWEILKDDLDKHDRLSRDTCYNVTPAEVKQKTDYMIFKFYPNDESFVLADGKAYELCRSFGGYGFINAVPWDYDENGVTDLLVAGSWGSGMHRGEVTLFDMSIKESILICDSFDYRRMDLCVSRESGRYLVHTARIEHDDNNEAELYVPVETIGTVTVQDGKPVFTPYSR